MKSRKNDCTSGDDETMSKDRRETILQRRSRVLGTRSLRYVEDNSGKETKTSGAANKRRSQILQAQRAHRQRTLDYIAELEAEVFRLRECETSLTSAVADRDGRLENQSSLNRRAEAKRIINIHVLIQCLNGQVAPGLWIPAERQTPLSSSSPSYASIDSPTNDRFYLASVLNQNTLSSSLESHDALTKMLFLNFSENIAPTLVAFDGLSNGYRSLLLPLAWGNDLVRYALLAASANHLRFGRPKLTKLALNFQSAAIARLMDLSNSGNYDADTKPANLAAIILLLINGTMNGGSDFELLLKMAKSWIEAMGENVSLKEAPKSAINEFLLDQISMIQLYAQPLLREQTVLLSQYDCYSPDLLAGNFSFGSRVYQIFSLLEDAIKQACNIYSYHISHDGPPMNIEHLLDMLKNTVEGIPNFTPGENALAWVYFIAAAESSTTTKRTFFAKRLMGIYERGTFSDVTSAFSVLHEVWKFQGKGDSWTKVLMQMPVVLK